jgi:hypothetical protein
MNHKRERPEPVEAIAFTGEVHALEDVLAAAPAATAGADRADGRAAQWRMPGALVPSGERYLVVRGLIGLLSGRGVPPEPLMAMAEAFLEHGCAKDPAKPIDLEPVRALVRDFTAAARATRDDLVASWRDGPRSGGATAAASTATAAAEGFAALWGSHGFGRAR